MNKRIERRGAASPSDERSRRLGPTFWIIAGAGAAFQAGSAAVDSATIADLISVEAVFALAIAAAAIQLGLLHKLRTAGEP